MKKTIVGFIILFLSTLALALPSPKEIEAAVNAGRLTEAETLLRDVIQEKPASAKARYELGQVLAREGKNAEARNQLLEARRIDPTLKFAGDPARFNDLLNKIPADAWTSVVRANEPARSAVAAPTAGETAFPWGYVLAGGGMLLLLWLLLRSMTAARTAPGAPSAAGGTAAGTAAGTVAGNGNGFGYGYGGGYGTAPAPSPGMGAGGGAVLGGLAGMAAGYGLAKVLESGAESHAAAHGAGDNGFTPIDSAPAQPDYGAFDAGSGDSWDSSDPSSGDVW